MVSSISSSIASTLGIGSGIDTAKLVEDLANASKAPRLAVIESREQANTAKISMLGTLSSTIDNFASSLSSLVAGGTLFTQPTTSNASIVKATALAGSRIGGLASQITVDRLATAQTLSSVNLASNTEAVGEGSLTLDTAVGSFTVTIDSSNNTLAGLARAINAANAGVTATTVKDSAGSRLVIKGVTGEANDYTLTLASGDPAQLGRFAYDPNVAGGMTQAQAAQDAQLTIDGVAMTRSTNSFSDVIEGVKIDLVGAQPGTIVSIGTSRPTDAIKTAVQDFVAAYNEVKALLNEATARETGPLRNDPGIREMQLQLARLTSTKLAEGDGPTTLAELGVRTNRDGTLTLDTGRLSTLLETDPDAVEAMFNPAQRANSDLISIISPMGRVPAGTYTLENIVANPPSGMIGGKQAIVSDIYLVGAADSAAPGLVIEPFGDVASTTITVDLGLNGAMKAIRDMLRASGGPLGVSDKRLKSEQADIAGDREKMDARDTAYRAQLEKQFMAMQSRLSAYSSTQSFLEQQVKIWTNGNN